MKPVKEILEDLYINQLVSPDQIAKDYNVSGRTIRNWLREYGIPRLGPSHLRKGKSAVWNIGIQRDQQWREKQRQVHLGKKPPNYGQGRIHFICEVCGKEVFDKPYRRKRTCSKECKDQLSHIYQGEKHWNYKGDEAGYKQRQRNWAQYREWRQKVLELADYTCARCEKRGGRMDAHHLYTWNNHANLRFDPKNGIALCWKCHRSFHKSCSFHDTTPEMFLAWLTMQ